MATARTVEAHRRRSWEAGRRPRLRRGVTSSTCDRPHGHQNGVTRDRGTRRLTGLLRVWSPPVFRDQKGRSGGERRACAQRGLRARGGRDRRTHASPTARRALDRERAVEGGDAVGEPFETGPPSDASAPPTPSSATSTTMRPRLSCLDDTTWATSHPRTWRRSRAPRRRRSRRPPRSARGSGSVGASTSTGTGERVASASTAGPEPTVGEHGGWIPRASSRRSSRAARAPPAHRRGPRSARCGVRLHLDCASRSESESATRRCCAPSWRFRSSRRARVVAGLDDPGSRRPDLLLLSPGAR